MMHSTHRRSKGERGRGCTGFRCDRGGREGNRIGVSDKNMQVDQMGKRYTDKSTSSYRGQGRTEARQGGREAKLRVMMGD